MTEPTRRLKVFLCHAHSDATTVRALFKYLRREGVDVWLDKEKLLPGADWELEIRRAVREADVVVVCLSKQFNQAGFRQKEVRIALDTAMEKLEGEIFIIPARLEECDTLESLRRWHWVDLFEEGGRQKLIYALRARADSVGASLRRRRGVRPVVLPAGMRDWRQDPGPHATFGQVLRARCRALGLPMEELTHWLGISSVTMARIETGGHIPSVELAERIAEALEIPPYERTLFIAWAQAGRFPVFDDPSADVDDYEPQNAKKSEARSGIWVDDEGYVWRDGQRLGKLPSDAQYKLLAYLIEHRGEVCSYEALSSIPYPKGKTGSVMLDGLLRHIQNMIERDPKRPKILVRVPRMGYKLVY